MRYGENGRECISTIIASDVCFWGIEGVKPLARYRRWEPKAITLGSWQNPHNTII